jgi:hypothetical protein
VWKKHVRAAEEYTTKEEKITIELQLKNILTNSNSKKNV